LGTLADETSHVTRVTIGGSRQLPPGQAPRWLIRFLINLPPDSIINLRSGLTRANRFEHDVARLCEAIQMRIRWWKPDPTYETPGRVATWERDYDMVEHSDLVLAFVTTGDLEGGESGTAHLVDRAQDCDVPGYLYMVEPDGSIALSGSNDVKNVWTERVPAG
jgi:hypothetical protein